MLQKTSIVGDIEKNFKIIEKSYKKCVEKNCDFFLTTELFLTGYPPQDLILRNDFLKKILLFKKKIQNLTNKKKTILVLNIPEKRNGKIFNSLFLFKNGSVIFKKNKSILPNYGVFDEKRYFSVEANKEPLFQYKNKKIKFLICEEMWSKDYILKNKKKADLIICINASPFEINKFEKRKEYAAQNVKFFKSDLIYINYVGCQDELIFDGGSFFMNREGVILHQGDFFKESEIIIEPSKINKVKTNLSYISKMETIYLALMYSLKNYMKNNNFKKVVIGLSGGIDSALCLMLSADVVASKDLDCFYLPTTYNSKQSLLDAKNLVRNLEIEMKIFPIESLRKKIISDLNPFFNNLKNDITEENIQSRIRGLLLMAISNKFNSLLITTGNKSELAVGYSTLYGDMCGGFSLIKDLYKTQVIELVKWRNNNIPKFCKIKKIKIIPDNIILKDPSAELKDNQRDEDSLPKYSILDKILELLIDKNYDLKSIKKYGFNEKLIKKVWKMIKNSEFKRYQSSIGPKLSDMSFDKDRRFPITNKFLI